MNYCKPVGLLSLFCFCVASFQCAIGQTTYSASMTKAQESGGHAPTFLVPDLTVTFTITATHTDSFGVPGKYFVLHEIGEEGNIANLTTDFTVQAGATRVTTVEYSKTSVTDVEEDWHYTCTVKEGPVSPGATLDYETAYWH